MNTSSLHARFQEAIESLRTLRARAALPEPDLEDEPPFRAEARRFAKGLAPAADADAAEIQLLADHAGAQAFWALLNTHWETMELHLQPAAFELLPNPMPYEVLCTCFLSLLETEEAPAPAEEEAKAGE